MKKIGMKKIGILGGMSAASTAIYYDKLCAMTRERLGGLHSPNLLIRSLDFAEIEALQMQGDWLAAGQLLNDEAKLLVAGGAELLLLATNTMHKLADDMMAGINIPLVHIADATATAIKTKDCAYPALIATRFTMEESFYTERLAQAGLETIIPNKTSRDIIHRIIYDELCCNIVRSESEQIFIGITEELLNAGADSIILGCTEVCMLLNENNTKAPLFDTTTIHCEAALTQALS